MTPTEAEILLSSKLAEKRSSVLSDEQAEEVSHRLEWPRMWWITKVS